MWTLFKYEDGSNPYIAKTEKEKQRIINKYKNRIEKIQEDVYYIKEKQKEIYYPLFQKVGDTMEGQLKNGNKDKQSGQYT